MANEGLDFGDFFSEIEGGKKFELLRGSIFLGRFSWSLSCR